MLLLLSSPARHIHTCLSALPGTMRLQLTWLHLQNPPSSLSATPTPCRQWYRSPLASLDTAWSGHRCIGCAACWAVPFSAPTCLCGKQFIMGCGSPNQHISTCKSFEKNLKSIYQGRKAEKYGMCYKPLHHWEDTSDAELSSIVKQVFITTEIQAQTQESPDPTLLPLA